MDLNVVALDLLAEDEDLLAALEGRDVVGVVDDLQVGVGLTVLDHVGDDRGEGDEAAVGGLQEDLERVKKGRMKRKCFWELGWQGCVSQFLIKMLF